MTATPPPPPASPARRPARKLLLRVLIAVVVAGATGGLVLMRALSGSGVWQAPPERFEGVWSRRHADHSIWYWGRYVADPAGGPSRPAGKHYVYRAGALDALPDGPEADAALAAVREEFDFTETDAPFLDRAWRPSDPPRAPTGALTGQWFVYNDDGTRRYAGRFVDGLQDGPQAMWGEDGTLYQNRWVRGVKQGPAQAFYPDDTLMYECVYVDDLREGPLTMYAPDGRRVRVEQFKGGELNGEAVQYGPHGLPTIRENYLNGELDGLRSVYDEAGRLRQQVTYAAGKLTGPFTDYYPDGKTLRRAGTLRDGKPHGWLDEFNAQGERTSRALFEDGVEADPSKPDWVTPDTASRPILPGAENAAAGNGAENQEGNAAPARQQQEPSAVAAPAAPANP